MAKPVDEFVPDPQVAKEFNVTLMTLWRWDHDRALDFPADQNSQSKFSQP